ncbi:hypothetical protein CD351_11090 [Erythrobacter sp. KY5]|uniref:hypothetical protein n=1 Tax=Erythrobacter sp. KY5 TaxID=2011159 RepID=UPI000DBF29BA|nr:hypothetical protein [Erythrobacter sp. KY5]AWW74971.1 hypothetical protein CD351_11090 [Erythrobacter sp. KY5]
MEDGDDFESLSSGEMAMVAGAAILSLVGTLIGLAGLLMWGIRTFEMMFPPSGDGPRLLEDFAPYLTALHFVLTLVITACGVLNMMIATRGRDFVEGGWKRWLMFSAVSFAAGVLFFTVPTTI